MIAVATVTAAARRRTVVAIVTGGTRLTARGTGPPRRAGTASGHRITRSVVAAEARLSALDAKTIFVAP